MYIYTVRWAGYCEKRKNTVESTIDTPTTETISNPVSAVTVLVMLHRLILVFDTLPSKNQYAKKLKQAIKSIDAILR